MVGSIDAFYFKYIIKDHSISLVQWISGCVTLAGLWLFFRRVKNQDKQLQNQNRQLEQQREQINIQINKEIDDRFNASVTLLASSETSARTGGIYSLYQLAIEPKGEKYRVQVAQILCSHIRSKTQERRYQTQHEERPSNEIQTAINILFKDINGVKGIYQQDFSKTDNFPKANLSHAYLQGAVFTKAQCQGAYFTKADCQGADFYEADCQGANFYNAQCQGTGFFIALCQGSNFREAYCQGASFMNTHCEGANFYEAHCQEIIFWGTNG